MMLLARHLPALENFCKSSEHASSIIHIQLHPWRAKRTYIMLQAHDKLNTVEDETMACYDPCRSLVLKKVNDYKQNN